MQPAASVPGLHLFEHESPVGGLKGMALSVNLNGKKWASLLCIFLLALAGGFLGAQSPSEDQIGFGEITLGAPVRGLPIACREQLVCEGPYNSLWVRVSHADGVVTRLDVVYSGTEAASGEVIRSSPITLPQAIRGHSIGYARSAPRLGYAGTEAGARIVVDVANGIAYFSDGALVESTVREVRYLPMTDPLVTAASRSLLSNHGGWLIEAARLSPHYKNLLADANRMPAGPGTGVRHEDVATRLEKMSMQVRTYATATLMLSEHVAESLKNHREPDPDVAAKLRKAFALLSVTEREEKSLMRDCSTDGAAEEYSAPLDLAEEAESRMKELVREGFVE